MQNNIPDEEFKELLKDLCISNSDICMLMLIGINELINTHLNTNNWYTEQKNRTATLWSLTNRRLKLMAVLKNHINRKG